MKPLKGFTLIELMLVVAIIAILAAVAIPAYLESVDRQYLYTECKMDQKNVSDYRRDNPDAVRNMRIKFEETGEKVCPKDIVVKPDQLSPAELNAQKIAELTKAFNEHSTRAQDVIEHNNTELEKILSDHKQLIESTIQAIEGLSAVDNKTTDIIAELNANIQQIQANKASQDAQTAEVLQNLANIYAPPAPTTGVIEDNDATSSANDIDNTTISETEVLPSTNEKSDMQQAKKDIESLIGKSIDGMSHSDVIDAMKEANSQKMLEDAKKNSPSKPAPPILYQ